MKKSTLILAGLLIAGTTSLNAGFLFGGSNKKSESKITASGNKVEAKVDKSKVTDSTVGMSIKASNSKVKANNNKVKAKVTGHSTVKNSDVGLAIEAR